MLNHIIHTQYFRINTPHVMLSMIVKDNKDDFLSLRSNIKQQNAYVYVLI